MTCDPRSGLLMTIAVLTLLLSGCGQRNPTSTPAAAAHEEPESAAAPTNRVDIPPMVRSNLGITFAKVERRRVASTVRIPGAFELEPRARREYRMMLPGRVELLVDEYKSVGAGDVLFRIRSSQWTELQQGIAAAEQDIASAEADVALTQARLKEAKSRIGMLQRRLETLAAAEFRRADLEAELANLELSLDTLRAEVRLAETRVASGQQARDSAIARASAAIDVSREELATNVARGGRSVPAYQTIDWIQIKAVDNGIVERLSVTDGAFAEATALILSTIDFAQVRFRATSLQRDFARLGGLGDGGTPARLMPPRAQTSGGGIGEAAPAMMMLGLEAQPDQRTISVLAKPEYVRPWMRPGISAYLEVEVDATSGPALAIPRSAIVQDGLTHIFFRRDPRDPNKAIRVEADMGPTDGHWVVINSGLMLNDEVVLDGVYELKLAADRSGMNQRGGHFHADGTWHPDH